jgi:uncharacterized repeat protein (TIGR01451 family)
MNLSFTCCGINSLWRIFASIFCFSLFTQSLSAQLFYGISDNNLISFQASAPSAILNAVPVTGIANDQVISGLDFRPNTGELYTLGYNINTGAARLYTLNLTTGVAMPIGSTNVMLATGMEFIAFDFNPTVDRIRVMGSNGANFRMHPTTGAVVATDGNLAFAANDVNASATPFITSCAYINSFAGAANTTLYNYDGRLNILTTQIPPNDGTQNTIGTSGIMLNSNDLANDMDIFFDKATQMNVAFFVGKRGMQNSAELFRVNLMTGEATAVGTIGSGINVSRIAAFIEGLSTAPLMGKLVYGLTTNNNLISFDANNPSNLRSITSITGVMQGQVLNGLDFRPATGQLYSLGYNTTTGEARIYTINLMTGMATPVGETGFNIGAGISQLGFDFNPTVDRIRLTGSNGANFRLHPDTGALVATDGTLRFATGDVNAGETPNIGPAAYTNNFIGATMTTLYNYDLTRNVLTTQIPPNDGVLNTIGMSGIMVNAMDASVGFDIVFDETSRTELAFLSANTGNSTADQFFTINLATGATTLVGNIGAAVPVKDIAVFIDRTVPMQIAGQLVYGLTTNNNLVSFDSENPEFIRTLSPLAGIASGQMVMGLDFRPATGQLYTLGYNASTGEARLYIVNPMNGMAMPVGMDNINLGADLGRISLDFNPTVDRIRVVSSSGRSFRLNPDTGALVATDGNLAFATTDTNAGAMPNVVAVAYTNSFAGSTTTTLYNIERTLNVLTTQIPPNDGVLNTIGSFGIMLNNEDPTVDFDIFYRAADSSNIALLAANVMGSTTDALYRVDLMSGRATLIGNIGFGLPLKNIAIDLRGPKLNLTITADPINYKQFENVTYTVTITNSGQTEATGVALSAGIPEGMVHTSNAVTKGMYNLFFQEWEVGVLTPGESATLTLVLFPLVNVPTITNFVQVIALDQTDAASTPNNNMTMIPNEDDEAAVTIFGMREAPRGGTANLSLTAMASNEGRYSIFEPITYTVTLSNSGPDVAYEIQVQAGLPEGFAFTSSEVTAGEYNGFFQRWDVDSLASGATATLELTVFPLINDRTVNNFFQVLASNQTDPNSTPGNGVCCMANEDDEVNVTIMPTMMGNNSNAGQDLRMNNVKSATIFPVPANNEVQIQIFAEAAQQNGNLMIYNSLGVLVLSLPVNVNEGFNEWSIDVSSLENGIYFTQIPGKSGMLPLLKS